METTTDRIGQLADAMRQCVAIHCVNRDGSGCRLTDRDCDEIASLLETITKLTRELDRRGKVIEAAQNWRRWQDAPYDDMARRDGATALRRAIDEYTREALRQSGAL